MAIDEQKRAEMVNIYFMPYVMQTTIALYYARRDGSRISLPHVATYLVATYFSCMMFFDLILPPDA